MKTALVIVLIFALSLPSFATSKKKKIVLAVVVAGGATVAAVLATRGKSTPPKMPVMKNPLIVGTGR